jgi:hypothetical protein
MLQDVCFCLYVRHGGNRNSTNCTIGDEISQPTHCPSITANCQATGLHFSETPPALSPTPNILCSEATTPANCDCSRATYHSLPTRGPVLQSSPGLPAWMRVVSEGETLPHPSVLFHRSRLIHRSPPGMSGLVRLAVVVVQCRKKSGGLVHDWQSWEAKKRARRARHQESHSTRRPKTYEGVPQPIPTYLITSPLLIQYWTKWTRGFAARTDK